MRSFILVSNYDFSWQSLSPGAVETDIIIRAYGPESAEMSKKYFNSYKVLQPKDIADAIVYVLSAPAHVNVDELTITPLQQGPF